MSVKSGLERELEHIDMVLQIGLITTLALTFAAAILWPWSPADSPGVTFYAGCVFSGACMITVMAAADHFRARASAYLVPVEKVEPNQHAEEKKGIGAHGVKPHIGN